MPKNKIPERHEKKLFRVKEVLEIMSEQTQICFRGGTALSLTYEAIERFSEDIDITVFKGEKSLQDIIKWMKEKFNDTAWITSVKEDKKKQFINIHFENDGPESGLSRGFSEKKIIIEYPKKIRTDTDFEYCNIEPYKGANFKMNIMAEKHIFADKASILIEKFSSELGFQWSVDERASARHIYDVQMLIQKKSLKKVEFEYIIKRIYENILKKDGEFRGGTLKKVENRITFFNYSIEKAFTLFKTEILKKEIDIVKTIKNLVHPGSDKINIKKFIKLYEGIFKFIFKNIKKKIGISEDK